MKSLLPVVLAVTATLSPYLPGQSPSAIPATTRLPIPATPGKKFDLAWVGKITRLADPQIAPDGKSIAVVITRPNYEEDLNDAELAVVDTVTCKTRFLTHGRKTA